MTQALRIETETAKASALLSTATELMHDGRLVSIAALNGMIDNICRLIQEDDSSSKSRLEPLLTDLNRQMDAFRTAMEEHYGFLFEAKQPV